MTNETNTPAIEAPVKAKRTPSKRKAPAKRTPKRAAAPKPAATLTAPQVAEKYNLKAKSFRQKMRAHPDVWEKIYVKEGTQYLFKNNKTTLAKIEAALA